MSGTVARVTEISATSDTSFEDAVKVGLARANETLRGVKSAWVKEQSVDVENGAVVALPRQLAGDVRPRVAGEIPGMWSYAEARTAGDSTGRAA